MWANAGLSVAALCITALLLKHSTVGAQVIGIAWSRVATCLLLFVPLLWIVTVRICQIRPRDFFSAIAPSLAGGAMLMLVGGLLISSGWFILWRPVFAVFAVALPSAVAASILILKLDPQLRSIVAEYLPLAAARRAAEEKTGIILLSKSDT